MATERPGSRFPGARSRNQCPMLRTIRGLVLAGGVVLGGCAQYTPIEVAAVPPTQEVRVRVTDEGALRLARRLGRITDDVTAIVAPHS